MFILMIVTYNEDNTIDVMNKFYKMMLERYHVKRVVKDGVDLK